MNYVHKQLFEKCQGILATCHKNGYAGILATCHKNGYAEQKEDLAMKWIENLYR